jgi:hypothetical protein
VFSKEKGQMNWHCFVSSNETVDTAEQLQHLVTLVQATTCTILLFILHFFQEFALYGGFKKLFSNKTTLQHVSEAASANIIRAVHFVRTNSAI